MKIPLGSLVRRLPDWSGRDYLGLVLEIDESPQVADNPDFYKVDWGKEGTYWTPAVRLEVVSQR